MSKRGSEKLGENALVPAHTGKCVDRLLDARLRLLPFEEGLELLLQIVNKSVRVRIQASRTLTWVASSKRSAMGERREYYDLLAGAFSSEAPIRWALASLSLFSGLTEAQDPSI